MRSDDGPRCSAGGRGGRGEQRRARRCALCRRHVHVRRRAGGAASGAVERHDVGGRGHERVHVGRERVRELQRRRARRQRGRRVALERDGLVAGGQRHQRGRERAHRLWLQPRARRRLHRGRRRLDGGRRHLGQLRRPVDRQRVVNVCHRVQQRRLRARGVQREPVRGRPVQLAGGVRCALERKRVGRPQHRDEQHGLRTPGLWHRPGRRGHLHYGWRLDAAVHRLVERRRVGRRGRRDQQRRVRTRRPGEHRPLRRRHFQLRRGRRREFHCPVEWHNVVRPRLGRHRNRLRHRRVQQLRAYWG